MAPDIHSLAGAYVLDALSESEREEFELHLRRCASCRREVEELQHTAVRLADPVAEPPPAALRDRIMDAVQRTPQLPPVVVEPRRRRWRQQVLLPAAAALLLVVAGLVAVTARLADRVAELERSTVAAELLSAPDVQVVELRGQLPGVLRIVLSPTEEQALVIAAGLPPAPGEQVYELWWLQDGVAIPAAVFDVEEDGRLLRVVGPPAPGTSVLAVTIEPPGGSPQPTSEPVLVGELPGQDTPA